LWLSWEWSSCESSGRQGDRPPRSSGNNDIAGVFVELSCNKKLRRETKERLVENIEEMIRTYIAQNILFSGDGYPYSDDASFLNEGIIDSMNVLELVMFVENNYGITVEDQDIVPDNFDSISKLAAYIRRKCS
jgi:acyl carrier protein